MILIKQEKEKLIESYNRLYNKVKISEINTEDYDNLESAKYTLKCLIDVIDLYELKNIRKELKVVRGHLKYIDETLFNLNEEHYDNFIYVYQTIDKLIEDIEVELYELNHKEIV